MCMYLLPNETIQGCPDSTQAKYKARRSFELIAFVWGCGGGKLNTV